MDSTLLEKTLSNAAKLGCSFSDVRYQRKDSEIIEIENKNLKSYSSDTLSGIGVRVVYGNSIGYSSTSRVTTKNLDEILEKAVKAAKAQVSEEEDPLRLVEITQDEMLLPMKIDPFDISPEEKISLAIEANKSAYCDETIKGSFTDIGFILNYSQIMTSEGTNLSVTTPLIGLSHSSVAGINGKKETAGYSKSLCAGWEFISGENWNEFTRDISGLAAEAVKARPPPSGTFPVVVDQDVIGLVLHEALGHASEADGVAADYSVLKGMLGKEVASEIVSVYDEGVVEGGYYFPFDDEGVAKDKTTIIEKGILKGYLHDRKTAKQLGAEVTGNGRLQDFQNIPIVRQTNFYMSGGDNVEDELFEGIDFGFLIQGKGGRGGQVDPGMGTFTFGVGPSRVIRKGEPAEMVRGVVISGSILETLKTVDAVGREVNIKTGVFGGCGKDGQTVKTGFGGPMTRIQKMTVGGREE